ncbi:MAG: hypothetical protein VB062_09690 [Christensenella sp.]|nr:hypothetical protein [Christensenella sp.]
MKNGFCAKTKGKIGNKKALIEKKNFFRQSLEKQYGSGGNGGNTRGADAFWSLVFFHSRAHRVSCLSKSFFVVYKICNRLSTSFFLGASIASCGHFIDKYS